MSRRNRRPRRHLNGRHMLTLGALSLFGVSAYELWIRLEDFWAWTQGIRLLSAVQQTSFVRNMSIIFETPSMRELGYKMLFLCATILFGLICLIRRNRAKGAWVLMVLDVAVGVGGCLLGVFGFHPSNWAQTLKLLPLILIMAGCITNYIHRSILKRRYRDRKRRHQEQRERERREREGHAA